MHRALPRRAFIHQLHFPKACSPRTGLRLGEGHDIRPRAPTIVSCQTAPPHIRRHATRDGPAPVSRRDDTIYALSTPEGKAGIAVIRISGPACKTIYHGLCPAKSFPKPRYASVRTLYHPGSAEQEILDPGALVLHFPAPRTVTGEDVLELHVHGGSATVKAVLSAIPAAATTAKAGGVGRGGRGRSDAAVIRYAEPGEFTKRAFLNDRLDLAQVEALSATLAAETEQQRRAAARGASGALGRAYEEWRGQLLRARAEVEALIDFSEDQHLDDEDEDGAPGVVLARGVAGRVREILRRVAVHEDAGRRAELLRGGVRVALLGPPNAGKSSLMNRVVGREASIVSGEPGTTRDVVEASLDVRGYLCTFADTAGFRGGGAAAGGGGGGAIGAVEREGIRRARTRALESDVVVALASVEPGGEGSGGHEIRYDPETLKLAAGCPQRLVVVNKKDAVSAEDLDVLVDEFKSNVLGKMEGLQNMQPILISCKEAEDGASSSSGGDPSGIRAMADCLVDTFSSMTSLPVALQDLHGVTERQRQLLAQCREQLGEYLDKVGHVCSEEGEGSIDEETVVDSEPDIAVAAEHLRHAANCLGRITGRGEAGDVEEILGVIFEKFCVGK